MVNNNLNNNVNNELNELKQQLNDLQQRKQQSIDNLQKRVNDNKLYKLVIDYFKSIDNKVSFKSCGNEFNKVFVKHDNSNIMFLLVKLNDTITFYTKTKVNETSISGNTYPKQYEFRTTLKYNEADSNMLKTILSQGIETKHSKSSVTKTTINELTKKIELLQQQLIEKNNEINEKPTKKTVNKK